MKANYIPSIAHLRRALGRDAGMVVRNRGGVVDVYAKPPTVNPNTPQQRITRDSFRGGTGRWRDLPPEVREEWNAFARASGRFFPRQAAQPLTGRLLFQSAAFYKELLGLESPQRAPGELPPPPPVRVEVLAASESDTLRLRLEHNLRPGAYSVVVRMTPPTLRLSRKPQERESRYVRGLDVSSTALLPESGGEITFTGCRFAVEPGQRFGVWIRIIRRRDGLAGQVAAYDFIRPEGPEENPPATFREECALDRPLSPGRDRIDVFGRGPVDQVTAGEVGARGMGGRDSVELAEEGHRGDCVRRREKLAQSWGVRANLKVVGPGRRPGIALDPP